MDFKKVVALLISTFCLIYSAQAQIIDGSFGYFNDAGRFSQLSLSGSARMQGLGGAQIALGGDPTAAIVNPAGLGFFNRSSFSITPSFNFFNTQSAYGTIPNTDYKGGFNINNMSLVIDKTIGDYVNEKFKGGAIGITLHRVNDFNQNFNYEGFNDFNSLIDSFLGQASGINPGNMDGRGPLSLAYYNYLINPVPNAPGAYDSFVLGVPRQLETVENRGSQYQINVAYGGNYDDRLYFGGGIGISTIRYSSTKSYREDAFEIYDSNLDDWFPDNSINNLILDEFLEIEGIGINANFGMIYRVSDAFRVGFSYTTPTINALNDESSSLLETDYNNFFYAPEDTVLRNLVSESDIILSQFTLQTPSRLGIGASFFFSKNGFVSGDVEFVNYANAQVSSRDFLTTSDNLTIQNLYRNVVNYRVGAEYRLKPFMLRFGYNYLASPLENAAPNSGINTFTAGVGYRVKDYYVDFSLVNTRFNQLYSPYTLSDATEPVVNIENDRYSALVTIGFNF